MAFAQLEQSNIPGDVIDIIAKAAHRMTLVPCLHNVPSAFEWFVARDSSTDDTVSKLRRFYGRDDVCFFTDSCNMYDAAVLSFNNCDYFIMWYADTRYGITYLIEGEYDYEHDVFTVDRFYYKSDAEAPAMTDACEHAPYIHHGLNGMAFSLLATIMGEDSGRCIMSFLHRSDVHWIDPDRVCSWFQREIRRESNLENLESIYT